VSIIAHLDKTKLYPEDLAYFSRGLENLNAPFLLSGHIKGKVNHFNFSPMDIEMGSSKISGRLEMDGLPSIKETFINARLSPSVVSMDDLGLFIPDAVHHRISPLNQIQLKGNFTGFVNDFVANGDLITNFGEIQSDINYKISENNISQSSYSGKLILTDFYLGRFLNDTINFQKVTLNGRINGRGFTKEAANFTLVGDIASVGLKGYNYSNIHSNARFANQFFQGDLAIDDPYLQFSMKGSIDLRPGKDLINVVARLDTALLHELKLSKEEVFLQSNIDINSRGLTLDSIIGSALLKNSVIRFRDETVRLDSIRLISANENGDRSLNLRSSMLDLSLRGDFYYSTLFHDLKRLVDEFVLNLRNDPVAVEEYYRDKPKTEQAYKATIKARVHDVNSLLQVLEKMLPSR